MMTKTRKAKEMTEASASVGLLLATALLIKMPHRRGSLLSPTDKVLSLEGHMETDALIKAHWNSSQKSSSNGLNAWPPFPFHMER